MSGSVILAVPPAVAAMMREALSAKLSCWVTRLRLPEVLSICPAAMLTVGVTMSKPSANHLLVELMSKLLDMPLSESRPPTLKVPVLVKLYWFAAS